MKTLKKILLVLAVLFILSFFFLEYVQSKWDGTINFHLMVFVCIGALISFTYLFLSFSHFLHKTEVRLLLFTGILLWGTWGYYTTADGLPETHRFLLSISASLSEFFPSRGSYDVLRGNSDVTDGDKFNWILVTFGLCCYLFSISILIEIFARKLTNKWQLFLTKFCSEDRRIFWCENPGNKEQLLANDIYNNNSEVKCIFSINKSDMESESVTKLIEKFYSKHNILCLQTPEHFHLDTLKAPIHFFITDNCAWNISMAQQVWQEIVKRKHKLIKKVDFYVRISGGVKNYWAAQWAERIQNEAKQNQNKPELEIHLLQESELIARKLIKENPLLKAPGVEIIQNQGKIKGNIKVLLLGFSDLGQAILRETVCDGQFLHTDKSETFSMDVIDYMPQNFKLFAARCQDAIKTYHISFFEQDVFSSDFYHFMEDKIASYNRIIIAFHDKTLCMDIAAQIVEIAKIHDVDLRSKMFINLPEAPSGQKNSVFTEFTAFGSLQECYSINNIINEELDVNARKINSNYNNGADNWSEIPLFAKDSSRSAAAGLYNLCRIMGMNDPENKFEPQILEQQLKNGLLDVYAETEHLRWNAFHFVRGIRKWDISHTAQKIAKANDIKAHMRHAALVDYNTLTAIDEKIIVPEGQTEKSNLKSFDREIITVILKEVLKQSDKQ